MALWADGGAVMMRFGGEELKVYLYRDPVDMRNYAESVMGTSGVCSTEQRSRQTLTAPPAAHNCRLLPRAATRRHTGEERWPKRRIH